MSDEQYHIMRMNGMSPSGLPLPEPEGRSELAASTGSETAGFKTVHMSLSVRGALRNRDYDWFIKEDGTPATKDEAFEFLCDMLADGWEKLPIGNCENFDKKTGCAGHRAESPNAD